MGDHHGHDHTAGASVRTLRWVLALTAAYLVAEVVGGLVFHSLALLSDAAHMLTDVAALGIALAAATIGQRPADDRRTYGYRRFEVLAACFNAVLLFAIAIYIFVEAIRRFGAPHEIHSWGMMGVALGGFVVNLVSLRLLSGGKDASFNLKGAYLEVWADMIGSAAVIAGALAIRFTGWRWIDPVVAVAIALWVLPRTWILLRDTTHVLLQGVPSGIALADVRQAIGEAPGVAALHDLHIWSLGADDVSCTVHVTLAEGENPDVVRRAVEAVLGDRFGIRHTAIQTEGPDEPYDPAGHP